MRVYVNEKKVAFRKKVANIASLIGLAVLITGMIITLRIRPGDPRYGMWVAIALATLIVGFIAAQIGNYNMRRFAKRPMRPDQVLDKHLKGLDDRYEIYHWLLPADHVLLGPAGLFVIVLRDVTDPVEAKEDRWSQPFSVRRLLGLFGAEGLGDPVGEALSQVEKLRKWLQKEDPDLVVDIQPVVFFTQNVPLTRKNPTIPPILPKEMKKFVRNRAKERGMNQVQQKRLRELFHRRVQEG